MKTFRICFCPWRRAVLSRTGQIIGVLFCVGGMFRVADAAVGVAPQRIEETRNMLFQDDKISRAPAVLKLVLELSGPEAESSTQSGRLKIDEAVDNTGASLIPHTDAFHDPSKFVDFENAFFRNSKFSGRTESVKPQVEIELALPARAAAKIARLRGSLELSDGGKTNTVELGGLVGAGKKTVGLPSGSPVTVAVVVPDHDNVRSLSLEITGDESALASVEVIDAGGKTVSTGVSRWSMNGGPVHQSMDLRKPLDASMKLAVKVISDRKIINVPFDLKDIALP
ncbi:MAG TPA: hypothetical protein VKV04_05015 [Verrucomicrobiae bacterium]|nr:hypothetical protein [Verrucomicrobiae bacterium]